MKCDLKGIKGQQYIYVYFLTPNLSKTLNVNIMKIHFIKSSMTSKVILGHIRPLILKRDFAT